jgi:2-polyprenyl-6-methoxyphenol hydroxylase-like FAD-dependent oxidoreductase
MEHQHYTIIGGGIAGLTAAIALQRIGITAHVYEASDAIKPVGAGLGLGVNAMKALRAIDLDEDVARIGQPLKSFSILDEHGKKISHAAFETTNGRFGVAVHRAELHAVLMSKLDPAAIHTGKRLAKFENGHERTIVHFEDGTQVTTRYLIVADGVHSKARQQLVPDSAPRFAGQTCWRGVVEHPDAGRWAPSETWGIDGRFGIVPLTDNRVYWFAVMNAERSDPRLAAFQADDLLRVFEGYHSVISDVLERSKGMKLIHGDVLDLKPISRFAYGRTVLIGDAAHATTPNLAQGACQAIEDAVVLADCLKQTADVERAFRKFEKRRLKRTHWIVNTSWRIGKVAQLEHPLLVGLRNTAFRMMPASANRRQLQRIEDVEFG